MKLARADAIMPLAEIGLPGREGCRVELAMVAAAPAGVDELIALFD